MAPLRSGVLIATFRCDAPARRGAFPDERRIEAGNEGGRVYRQVCAALVALFAAPFRCGTLAVPRSDAVREAGARTDSVLFTPARSSPHSSRCARALRRVGRRAAHCCATNSIMARVPIPGRVVRRGVPVWDVGGPRPEQSSRLLIASFPSRCARALRRVVAATEADPCGRARLVQSHRALRLRRLPERKTDGADFRT